MIQILMKKSAGGPWLSQVIDQRTGGLGYCHVAIYFEELGLVFEASDECGVKFRDRAIDLSRECGYRLDLTDEQERKVLRKACELAGNEYDYRGLFNFELSIIKQDRNRQFCSEAAVLLMQEAGYLARWDASKVSPNRFSKFLFDGSLPVIHDGGRHEGTEARRHEGSDR